MKAHNMENWRNFLCIVLSSLDTQYLRWNFYFSKTHHNLHYAVNPMVIHMILKKRLYFSLLPRTTSSKQQKNRFIFFFYSKYRVPSKASEFCWTRNFFFIFFNSMYVFMCVCLYVCGCMFVSCYFCGVVVKCMIKNNKKKQTFIYSMSHIFLEFMLYFVLSYILIQYYVLIHILSDMYVFFLCNVKIYIHEFIILSGSVNLLMFDFVSMIFVLVFYSKRINNHTIKRKDETWFTNSMI